MSTSDFSYSGDEMREGGPLDAKRFIENWKQSKNKAPFEALIKFLDGRAEYLFGTEAGITMIFDFVNELIRSISVPPTLSTEDDEVFSLSELTGDHLEHAEHAQSLLHQRRDQLMGTIKNELLQKFKDCVDYDGFGKAMTAANEYIKQCNEYVTTYCTAIERVKGYKQHCETYVELRKDVEAFEKKVQKHEGEPLLKTFKKSGVYTGFEKHKVSTLKTLSPIDYLDDLHDRYTTFYFDDTAKILFDCKRHDWKYSEIAVTKLKQSPGNLNIELKQFINDLKNVSEELVKQVVEAKKNQEVAEVSRYTGLVEPFEPKMSNAQLIHFNLNEGVFMRLPATFVLENYATLSLERLDKYMQEKYPQAHEGELTLNLLRADKVISASAEAVLITGACRWGAFKVKTSDPNVYFTLNAYYCLLGGRK